MELLDEEAVQTDGIRLLLKVTGEKPDSAMVVFDRIREARYPGAYGFNCRLEALDVRRAAIGVLVSEEAFSDGFDIVNMLSGGIESEFKIVDDGVRERTASR